MLIPNYLGHAAACGGPPLILQSVIVTKQSSNIVRALVYLGGVR